MRYEGLSVHELDVDKCSLHGEDMGIGEKVYVDVTNGSNGNSGKTANSALKTVAAGESMLVTGRNDNLRLLPGMYPVTSEIAWDKDNTHIIGLAGPNVGGNDYYHTSSCIIYTVTTEVVDVIDVTGAHCQFHDVNFLNNGDNTANISALNLDGLSAYFKRCGFWNQMCAGTDGTTEGCSLYIDGDGSYPIFEECQIGQNVWDERTGENSGVLNFTGGASDGTFRNCRFLSRSDTAAVAMVRMSGNYSIGRGWYFDNCLFNNFSTNLSELNQCFYETCVTEFQVILHNCIAVGIHEWTQSANNGIVSDMPAWYSGGGLTSKPLLDYAGA